MNVNDTHIVQTLIEKDLGWKHVDSVQADFVLLNTCAIREGAEAKVLRRLTTLRTRPDSPTKQVIGVMGCMAERLGTSLIGPDKADLVIGPDSFRRLPAMVLRALDGNLPPSEAVAVGHSKTEVYDDLAIVSAGKGLPPVHTAQDPHPSHATALHHHPHTITATAPGLVLKPTFTLDGIAKSVLPPFPSSTDPPADTAADDDGAADALPVPSRTTTTSVMADSATAVASATPEPSPAMPAAPFQPPAPHPRLRQFVSITRGCNNRCAFCIVPTTRGAERHRAARSVAREVATLVAGGAREVVLLGQNVNSWVDVSEIGAGTAAGVAFLAGGGSAAGDGGADGGGPSVGEPSAAVANDDTVSRAATFDTTAGGGGGGDRSTGRPRTTGVDRDAETRAVTAPGFSPRARRPRGTGGAVRFAELLSRLAAPPADLRGILAEDPLAALRPMLSEAAGPESGAPADALRGAVWAGAWRRGGPTLLRFTSPHPKDFPEEVFVAIANNPAVAKEIHMPLQSGSTGVLSRMARGYSQDAYLSLVAAARAAIPGVAVTTDIIVGFCGETDAEHKQTLEAIHAAKYEFGYAFMYSERPGTPAARRLVDDITPSVKRDRLHEVLAALDASGREAAGHVVGTQQCVMLDAPVRPKGRRTPGGSGSGAAEAACRDADDAAAATSDGAAPPTPPGYKRWGGRLSGGWKVVVDLPPTVVVAPLDVDFLVANCPTVVDEATVAALRQRPPPTAPTQGLTVRVRVVAQVALRTLYAVLEDDCIPHSGE